MNQLAGRLPEGVTPQLGPDATAVGWVFQYALVDESGQHDLAALRSFQDWSLRYWLRSVDGVAEVASVGGAAVPDHPRPYEAWPTTWRCPKSSTRSG